MPFYKVTYSEKYRRASVHNRGCDYRCIGCAYKIREVRPVEHWPSLEEIKATLLALDLQQLNFMGGEPTSCPDLPEMLRFGKDELGVRTMLGHTTAWRLPLENLDAANVSLKAFSNEKHLEYTGKPAEPAYANFRRGFEAGIEMKASCVYIPGFIDREEIRGMLEYLAGLSPAIPFHIMGYIPIPGTPWQRPMDDQMREMVEFAKGYLETVTFSHLTVEDARDYTRRDDRFRVVQVL